MSSLNSFMQNEAIKSVQSNEIAYRPMILKAPVGFGAEGCQYYEKSYNRNFVDHSLLSLCTTKARITVEKQQEIYRRIPLKN